MDEVRRCGYVAIVGRPNVGKSTLLNHLLGQKLAITSRRPQTTRHTLLGIHTRGAVQMLFVDTPGIHGRSANVMNRRMNRAALGALHDVDVVLFVVDRLQFGSEDEAVLAHIAAQHERDGTATSGVESTPAVIAVINKVDRLDRPEAVLPAIAALSERFPFRAIVPLSALRERNLDRLLEVITECLPAGEHLFAADEITDRPLRFLVAEIIREKLMRQLGDELPYQSAVVIEGWKDTADATRIQAQILVEKASQRAIVIGRGGGRLRDLGREARLDIERLLERRVHLSLWVKVRQGWADNARLLAELGHDDERG